MSTIKKAVLTQVQSDILDDMSGIPVGELAFDYAEGEFLLVPKELRTLGLHTFMTAIYVGYEVEKSSEEKFREIYDTYDDEKLKYDHQFSAYCITQVLKEVLEALDVKIEGVNIF